MNRKLKDEDMDILFRGILKLQTVEDLSLIHISSAETHCVRSCIRVFAVSDTVLLHISEGLRRRGIAVPRDSLARCYRQGLRR